MKSESALAETPPVCSDGLWCYMGGGPLGGGAERGDRPSGLPHWCSVGNARPLPSMKAVIFG